MTVSTELQNCLQAISLEGMTTYFVGGCVRDGFMGIASDDIDVCVVGCKDFNDLRETILKFADSCTAPVGEAFKVLIADFGGEKIDFALARKESSTGNGYQDFEAVYDGVTIEEDLARRDLTINAIAENCITNEIIDPFDGKYDIVNKVADLVGPAFSEDPLRVYRAARFVSRFDLEPGYNLLATCRDMDLHGISNERVGMELKKMFAQASTPSKFFDFLRRIGQLDVHFPEVAALVGVKQDPIWHPEGDAYIHTMHCLDQATDPFIRCVMLCHDLGKATTTVLRDGRYRASGHARAGVDLTLDMLSRISFMDGKYQQQVALMVDVHMFHSNKEFTRRAVTRMVRKLQKIGLTFDQLVEVSRCDVSGRPPLPEKTPYIGQDIAHEVVIKNQSARIVNGKMLIDLGFTPGKKLGDMLRGFEILQDEGTLNTENWEDFIPEMNLFSDLVA